MIAGRTTARFALFATALAMAAWLTLSGTVLVATVARLRTPAAVPATAPAAEAGASPPATAVATAARSTTVPSATARVITDVPPATPSAAAPLTDDAAAAIVDWPDLPEVASLAPITTTAHFTVTATDAADRRLVAAARRWAPRLEPILAEVEARVGRDLPSAPVVAAFARAYDARCPARGLASPGDGVPYLVVMVDETTPEVQIRAVLAHEMVHHLTHRPDFVGDAVLTEGVANWGAGPYALAWQGWSSWDEAARAYLADGTYVSVADDAGQVPREGEDCIARRDRVYNVRAAFVTWLVATYGRDTVLAMPARETPDPDDPEGPPLRSPDYVAATGSDLVGLERRWLAELTGRAALDATPVPRVSRTGGPMAEDAASDAAAPSATPATSSTPATPSSPSAPASAP